NIDHFHLVNLECHDLADCRQSERLERARHGNHAIADFRCEHFGGQLLFVQLVAQLKILDVVKEFNDFFVGAVAKRTQESSGEKFAPALASIKIDIKKIGSIKLHLNPGTPVRNDAEAVEHFPVKVDCGFKSDSRRAMQLADYDPLCTIDHESALRRHERDFAHVNFLFL